MQHVVGLGRLQLPHAIDDLQHGGLTEVAANQRYRGTAPLRAIQIEGLLHFSELRFAELPDLGNFRPRARISCRKRLIETAQIRGHALQRLLVRRKVSAATQQYVPALAAFRLAQYLQHLTERLLTLCRQFHTAARLHELALPRLGGEEQAAYGSEQ